jgi:hypothetical protein
MRLWGRDYTRSELMQRVGRLDQIAGVRLVTAGDGLEREVRLLEFRTGSGFEFDVVVDRAFDIGRCELNGQSLAWQSSVGFGGPWFAEHEGLGWLRNWGGGLLTTCGLDHALFMAEDTAEQYHYPPKDRESFGLHGRISNRPAFLRSYGSVWDGDECTLYAEGEVVQASVFGENLVLRRRIETRVGSNHFTIRDVVENAGWNATPHMYLYHINIGFPVVDDGSEILVPTSSIEARGDHPVEGYRTLDPPEPAHVERVYEHDVIAEADGSVPVGIVNRLLGTGAYEVFNHQQLPFHFVWRMLGQGQYAVGIEPCTNRTGGRLDARERGELIVLEPGQSRTYDLELGALRGEEEIEAFANRVEKLGGV